MILYTLKVNLNLETLELFYLYYYEYLGNVIKCRTFLKPIGIGHAQLRFAHGQIVHILSMCRCQILMYIFVFDDAWAPEHVLLLRTSLQRGGDHQRRIVAHLLKDSGRACTRRASWKQ